MWSSEPWTLAGDPEIGPHGQTGPSWASPPQTGPRWVPGNAEALRPAVPPPTGAGTLGSHSHLSTSFHSFFDLFLYKISEWRQAAETWFRKRAGLSTSPPW